MLTKREQSIKIRLMDELGPTQFCELLDSGDTVKRDMIERQIKKVRWSLIRTGVGCFSIGLLHVGVEVYYATNKGRSIDVFDLILGFSFILFCPTFAIWVRCL